MASLTLIHFPVPARTEVAPVTYDRMAEYFFFAQIIGATFLQKFAISLGGDMQIYVATIVMLGVASAGLVSQRLFISGPRAALFALMVGGLTLTQLVGGQAMSALSLLLLAVTHSPYIFRLQPNYETRPGIELEFYQKAMTVLAVLGITQYVAQHFIPWQYVFPFDGMLPQSMIFQGFHGLNPIGKLYKATGIFMLEPAIFSQFLALAIIIEMVRGKAWRRMVLYAAALGVTYSGTGLVMLALIVPFILIRQRRYGWCAFLLAAVLAVLFVPLPGLERFTDRLAEFTNSETSAYARFLSMFHLIHDAVLPQPGGLFFGLGAGSIKDTVGHYHYAVHDPSWGKIVFEYGLIGALAYFPLIVTVFAQAQRSNAIKAALALQFLFLGEYILSPTVHGLVMALLAWPTRKSQEEVV